MKTPKTFTSIYLETSTVKILHQLAKITPNESFSSLIRRFVVEGIANLKAK